MPQYKVIQGPIQSEGKTYQDGEIFEADAKAIAPLIQAAVVVEATSSQEPLSQETGGSSAPQSPTEILEEEATLPQSLIEEKNETLEELGEVPKTAETSLGEIDPKRKSNK